MSLRISPESPEEARRAGPSAEQHALDEQLPPQPADDRRRERQLVDRRLVALWMVVTALWTTATLLRIERAWVPKVGWQAILDGPWLWLSLGLPPFIFGLIFTYLRQIILFRRHFPSGSIPKWRDRKF